MQGIDRVTRAWRTVVLILGLGLLLVAPEAWGQAACVGDCDDSGAVTIDELVTIGNFIFEEDPDLSQCQNADPNGDGQVNVNEVLLANCNALSSCTGCPGSGPQDPVTIDIGAGSVGGPGQSTSIPFSMTDGAGTAAAIQLDVGFDPSDLDVDIPTCVAGAAVGSAHTFSATLLQTNPGVRLVVLPNDLVIPLATLSQDGEFASCNFRVDNFAAPPPWALNVDYVGVGDDNANDLETVANGSQITCCGC